MSKKKIAIILIIVFITVLWISRIIPMGIARIYGSLYLKKHYPELQFKYDNIEWSKYHNEYVIHFKDKNGEIHGFTIGPKYFPVSMGEGIFQLYNESNIIEQNNEKDERDLNGTSFLAEIENVYPDNKLLVKGIAENDINFRGEFFAYITDKTEILKNRNKADITDIEAGQKVKITFTNGIQESSPAVLGKVIKIEIIK